ncbi:uncharacterized protein LOC129240611 [Anastrepha obliqua]|uniref:uncharacterized protein LOC129240611 n=1 Tax=Anastrepha obliqua TaxID=95512 RepID=UPI00240A6CBD|nr:uncharacterized protein LOC129240611 [Anastrepha obliqua]
MRRSTRLIKKNTSLSQKTPVAIQIQKGSTDNGNMKNEEGLLQFPQEELMCKSDIATNSSKLKIENEEGIQKFSNGGDENTLISKQSSLKPGLSVFAGRGRKRCVVRPKTAQQYKRSRSAVVRNSKTRASTIPIDNYLNPLRKPLIKNETSTQPLLNDDFYCYNPNIQRMNIQSNTYSLLPPLYPTHFSHQNNSDILMNPPPQLKSVSTGEMSVQTKSQFQTPDITQSLDFDSSTSTLSLPDSVREVFGCYDIRDILKLDKTVYRMRLVHLQILAFVLNIEYDYLHNLVQKIMQLDTETLKKVILAFQPEADLVNLVENSEE